MVAGDVGGSGMTRWVAILEDNPQADWVRQQHSQAHFDYLAAHKDRILLGGGLRPAPGEWSGTNRLRRFCRAAGRG